MPGAGDGAGAPRFFFAILLQQVVQPVGPRLPHLDGGAVSTRWECSLDSQMFVNSEAGINKLGLISTALPEVCTDSRAQRGRESGPGHSPALLPQPPPARKTEVSARPAAPGGALAPAQGRWAPGRAAERSFFLPEPIRREHGVPSAGSARSTAGEPGAQPRVGAPHLAALSPPLRGILMLWEPCAACPGAGFLPLEPPADTRGAQKCAGLGAPSLTRGNAGASGECGASEGSVPPPSLPPALPGAGAGSTACPGLWEPGRPCRASRAAGGALPGAAAGASAPTEGAQQSRVPGQQRAEPLPAGSSSRGRGAAGGSPARKCLLRLLVPFWVLEGTSAPAPPPASFPKEDFWE